MNREHEPFPSNALKMSAPLWCVAGLFLLVLYFAVPRLWKGIEQFEPGPDYRIPYSLSEDYWLYHRYAGLASQRDAIPIVGDSVIWGQYVVGDETLSHFLNAELGSARCVNMGVNGTHPAALAGLVKHYAQPLKDRRVVVHLNPLWMSSKRHDLQDERARRFNHPRLVPQFYPPIPSYEATFAERIGTVIDRESSLLSWTAHLRVAYYRNKNIPNWTLEHPYTNPLQPITLELPKDGDTPPSEPIPWMKRDMGIQDFAWVPLEDSLQWGFFRESIGVLRNRGNQVFVILGPFNEHMLSPASLETYKRLREGMESWLRAEGLDYVAPQVLPTELYADASHPLREGYALLARNLLDDPTFQEFVTAPQAALSGSP
ncbi:MAG: hypothetical protein IT365_21595 [Candidatus Hydrogenedentes bacterium]|nr:hypothetical protein [Candidatus Hydrogenedentota bacterium]